MWDSALGGNRTCYASEHSCIDLNRKELSLRSRNLTFNNVVHVDEKLTYSIHPHDENKTLLRQEAQITVRNVPLIDYMEAMMASTINGNAHKGRQAIEFIIAQMNQITDKTTNTFASQTAAADWDCVQFQRIQWIVLIGNSLLIKQNKTNKLTKYILEIFFSM